MFLPAPEMTNAGRRPALAEVQWLANQFMEQRRSLEAEAQEKATST
jgi:hypothetical protein